MAEKLKRYPGTILPATVNTYSFKVATKDSSPERQYHYAQLRTAMKHLVPENARLKAEVERLKKREADLQRKLQTLADAIANTDLEEFQKWLHSKYSLPTV